MHSMTSFRLNFSGPEVLEQRRIAEADLARLEPGDHTARARLLAVLTTASLFMDPEVAKTAAEESARAARDAGDDLSRAWSLLAMSIADLSCAATESRLTMTRDALQIATVTGESEFVETAYFLHLSALAELGRMNELDYALSPVGPLLTAFPDLADGRHVARFRCLQATLAGDIKRAEQLAQESRSLAQEITDPDTETVFIGQIGVIRWAQGRVVELEPLFLQARQAAPHEPIWGVSLAWMWLKQGRKSAARALVSSLPPISELPVDRNWLSTACVLAEVVAELRDDALAEQLSSALLPYADRLVTIGLGVTCWGTVARPLALLHASLGDTGTAIRHYRDGIDITSRSGAHPWLAEMQTELAALLAQSEDASESEEAVALATEAVSTARALQLHGIEGAAANLLADLGASPLSPHESTPAVEADPAAADPKPRITVLGDFSVNSADGAAAHWQSRKARQLLKVLIARRGAALSRESLMDMLWPDIAPAQLANRFSVAANAVRRALDPSGSHGRNTYLEYRDGLMRLRVEALQIDSETFLAEAGAALAFRGPADERITRLGAALDLYTGEPLHEEQEELWAADFAREAHLAFFAAAHALAELHAGAGDQLSRLETYRRIIALDEFDQRAHEGIIDALTRLGSPGQADAARRQYVSRMDALGVPLGSEADS